MLRREFVINVETEDKGWLQNSNMGKLPKQAGAELCQAQLKLSLIGAGLTDQN